MSYHILLLVDSAARDEFSRVPSAIARLGIVNVITEDELVPRLDEGCDLIVADVTKGANVDTALARLREHRSSVPLVVLSGAADWREVRRLLQAGATDYLSTGLDQNEMQQRLRAALALSTMRAKTELWEEKLMNRKHILLADNDKDFLETRAEMLERAGYRVTKVGTPKAASRILQNTKVDLAILDIRLLDDDDEKDNSGFTVAKESQSPVPVIILTNYPDLESTRVALSTISGESLAVNYVWKQEGFEALQKAVRQALDLGERP